MCLEGPGELGPRTNSTETGAESSGLDIGQFAVWTLAPTLARTGWFNALRSGAELANRLDLCLAKAELEIEQREPWMDLTRIVLMLRALDGSSSG